MNVLEETLSPALRDDFDRDGFVILRHFFNASEVAEFHAEMERYLRDVAPGLPPGQVMYENKERPETLKLMQRLAEHDERLREILYADRVCALAERLLGLPIAPQELEWFNKVPRASSATPPHQDGYYFMIEPQEALTMWVALDPVDEENGCLRYVRGSNRKGLRPHIRTKVLSFSQGIPDYGPADQQEEIAISAEPGDVLVHHGLTIHSAHANRSANRQRRSLGLVYYSARAKQDVACLQSYQAQVTADWTRTQKI